MMSFRTDTAHIVLLILLAACDYREDLSYTPPATNTPTDEMITLAEMPVRVVDQNGTPRSTALVGTIPTLNPRETVVGSDGQERAMTIERYLTDANGEYVFRDQALPLATSPI